MTATIGKRYRSKKNPKVEIEVTEIRNNAVISRVIHNNAVITDHVDAFDRIWQEAHQRGLARASKLGLFTGLDRSHAVQGSNFNPRGWGRS